MRSMRETHPFARVAATTMALGATLWIAGNIVLLGGHRAVGLMATHRNPLPTVGPILFTVEIVADAFRTAAFAIVGVAMLTLAIVAIRAGVAAWGRYTAALGVVSLVLSVAYMADNGDLENLLLLAFGVLIVPAWLVWTGMRFGSEED